jgi:hypothetical protein
MTEPTSESIDALVAHIGADLRPLENRLKLDGERKC